MALLSLRRRESFLQGSKLINGGNRESTLSEKSKEKIEKEKAK